jgi:hypothetical protein
MLIRTRTTRGLAAVAIGIAVLAGCAGNDNDGAVEDAAPAADDAQGSGDPAASATTTAADDDANEVDLGAEHGGSYCDAASDLEQQLNAAMADITSSAEAGPVFSAAVGALEDVADLAPAEIADDVDTIANSYSDFIAALEAVDYDFLALTPEQQSILTSPEMQAASERVDEYGSDVCGFPRPQS